MNFPLVLPSFLLQPALPFDCIGESSMIEAENKEKIVEHLSKNEISLNTSNPGKLKEWKDMLNKTGVDKISDDTEFNLNEFLSIDFTTPLPTYTARDLRKYPNLPKKLAFPILCLIEKLVNGIIDFLWSLLGIEALTKAPHITLCKDNDIVDSIPSSDVNDILNSGQKPLNDSGLTYDITLPNGEVVKGLDQEALDQYRKDHDDIDYSLNF